MYDELQYRSMSEKNQQLPNAHYSIKVNDNLSSRERYDYKLETANRSVKSHLPRASVPTEKGWLAACRNNKTVRAIREKLDNITGLTSEMAKPQERIVDVSAAIHRWHVVLRGSSHCSDNYCSDNHCTDNHCSDNYCSDDHCYDAENDIFDIQ